MYSTLKQLSLAAAAAAVVTMTGCNSAPMQRVENHIDNARSAFVARIRPSENVIDNTMVDPMPDKATELRGFQTSTFVYPNGAVLAYPTYGLNYEDRPRWLANDYVYSLATPFVMAYDLFAMPVYMAVEPPTTAVAYHGARAPVTMTLSPPLPPLPQQAMRQPTEAPPEPMPQTPTALPEATPAPTAPLPSPEVPVPAPAAPDAK